MQTRATRNRRPPRLLTTFVALLYVFLSTFGVLTHATAHSGDAREARYEGVGARTRGGQARHAFTAQCLCTFCNWQADTVSAAIPIGRLYPPDAVTTILFASPATRQGVSHALRASSRAPPRA